MKEEEGYIKFNCIWTKEEFVFPVTIYNSLTHWRQKLYNLQLIGMYKNNVGYGNISIRDKDQNFIITGSKTGGKEKLDRKDYALVTHFRIDQNEITCRGFTKASSETMSHAALYSSSDEIGAVIHVHHRFLWDKLYGKVPTTDNMATFGTPEMAAELMCICKSADWKNRKIIVMGGHQEGLITFGKDIDEAGEILLEHYYKYSSL